MLQILQLLFPKLLFLSPQKMDEFNLKLAQYCINQIFELTKSPVFGRFQNGCNEVAIELFVEQFWSEITLVITNQTCAVCSLNFEITNMISASKKMFL